MRRLTRRLAILAAMTATALAATACGDRQLGRVVAMADRATFWVDRPIEAGDHEFETTAAGLVDEYHRVMFGPALEGDPMAAVAFAHEWAESLEAGATVRVLAREETPGGAEVVKVAVERSAEVEAGTVGLINVAGFEAVEVR